MDWSSLVELRGSYYHDKSNKMSWFGFGGGDDDPNKKTSSSSGSSAYDTSFPGDAQHDRGFSPSSMNGGAPPPMSAGGMDPFQQQLMATEQNAMAQAVVFSLAEKAFEKCVSKPGSSLSSSELSCIKSTAGKYIEASEFIVQAMTQGQGGQ